MLRALTEKVNDMQEQMGSEVDWWKDSTKDSKEMLEIKNTVAEMENAFDYSDFIYFGNR